MKVPGRSHFWTWLSLLQLLASGTEQEDVAGPAVQLPRGRGAAVPRRRPWVLEGCRRLSGLLRQKAVVLNKLEDAVRAVERDASLSDQEKLFRVHTLEIFQKELNESENSVFQAVHGLQRALQGDYRDVANMKESSRQRLEALREAAIKAGPGRGRRPQGCDPVPRVREGRAAAQSTPELAGSLTCLPVGNPCAPRRAARALRRPHVEAGPCCCPHCPHCRHCPHSESLMRTFSIKADFLQGPQAEN